MEVGESENKGAWPNDSAGGINDAHYEYKESVRRKENLKDIGRSAKGEDMKEAMKTSGKAKECLEAGSQPKPAAGSQAELEPLEILWAGGYGLHLGFKIAGYRPKKNKIKRLPVTVHVANLLTPFKSNMSLTIANQYTTAHVPRTRAQHLAMYHMPQDLHMSWVFVPLKNSQSHGPKAGPAQAMGGGSGLTFSRPKPLKAGPKPQLSGQAGPANH
ncbi:hypothetical protein H4582DRAFT_2198692 [Lactarius indigo]|nr:hypothetical protein H4582DRAFT_2198692 [Lactarius indigo]